MGGRPKSQDQKAAEASKAKEKYMKIATNRYKEERAKESNGLSLNEVISEVELQARMEMKVKVKLSKSTLSRHINGGRSIREFNSSKGWLTPEEEDLVVTHVIALADRGFPVTLKRIIEQATLICVARLGHLFPENGFGKQWGNRFVLRHKDRLKGYWSTSLDHSRARAVNPYTKQIYFNLLRGVLYTKNENGEEILMVPELIYGVDETGIQSGVGVSERVYGGASKKIQHQQRSGDRENITVIVTICADGSSLAPAVIFKGTGYQASWKQNNPLNASLGHSKKGYTDGEIGVEYLKNFDKQTQGKANGQWRLLLVDGHNSHYTLGFLNYARENHIHVLCYPSHSTHIYQGLDVVIFSVLKRRWSEARDAYERSTGEKVSKSNFLGVYATAHTQALTSENIISAFRKTGVVPFDPGVVTEEMMAPSLETSTTAALPVPIPSPVRVISQMLHSAAVERRKRSHSVIERDDNDLEENDQRVRRRVSISDTLPQITQNTIDALAQTASGSFITSPLTGSTTPPLLQTEFISPTTNRYAKMLDFEPETEREILLAAALRDAQRREAGYKAKAIKTQAAMVLQNVYVLQAQSQLQTKEKPKKRSKKVFGDGLPRLLDGDAFVEALQAAENEAQEQAEAKEKRKSDRIAKKQSSDSAKALDRERIARNNERRKNHKEDVARWEVERDLAKAEKRRPRWQKPKLEGIEPAPRRSKKQAQISEEEGEDDDDEQEEEEDRSSASGDSDSGSD